METAWAQLVSVTDMESPEIPLVKDKYTIGRNSDCDLPHAGNKLVSGKHCYIERDGNGKVWLYDTSTNGTLLNLSIKLAKGECRELHHGDEIYIVHKKTDTKDDIGYMFQDMEALKAEPNSDLEDTQEYTQVMNDLDSTLADEDVNAVTTPSPLKKRKSTEISPAVNKRIKIDSALAELSSTADDEKKENKITAAIDTPDTNADKNGKISSTAEAKKAQDEASDTAEGETRQGPAEKPVVPKEPVEDAMAETLVCIICQELLHDCISLQPCMHSFCAGCYSEWMERSQECPSCRLKVARINKNHIVNNLVEAYLKTRPDMKRPEADLKELDGKNKITRDMLYPARKPKRNSDDESNSDSYTDDDYQDSSYVDTKAAPLPFNNFNNQNFNFTNLNHGGVTYGFGNPFFGTAPVVHAQTICRQCLGNKGQQNEMALRPVQLLGAGATGGEAVPGPSTTAGPSADAHDPDEKTFPTPVDFTCPVNGNHILCLCCLQPMPDRRYQYVNGGTVPPQQCQLCYGLYCHAYWGCRKAECNGCLANFKDLNFGKKCLTSLVLDNHYESKILADYINGLGMSVKDLFKACMDKVDAGEYSFINQARINALHGWNTPVCYGCGFRAFKEIAYNYRRDIPADRLPKEVTSRPNCYWGKNCRTQRNKPEHATRFNHICEQSRTTM